MKSRSRSGSVGQTLRRTLGGLLALGFGATWWSFMPPADASTPPAAAPRIAARVPPPAVARRVTSVPAFTNMPTHPEQLVPLTTPTTPPTTTIIGHKPTRRPVKRPPRLPQPPIVDPPVVEPQTPVVETPPVVVPKDEPVLPRIRTRSS